MYKDTIEILNSPGWKYSIMAFGAFAVFMAGSAAHLQHTFNTRLSPMEREANLRFAELSYVIAAGTLATAAVKALNFPSEVEFFGTSFYDLPLGHSEKPIVQTNVKLVDNKQAEVVPIHLLSNQQEAQKNIA